MLNFSVQIEFDVRAHVNRLRAELEREMSRGIETVARNVAQAARQEHGYSNRTGLLERSTIAVPASGRFLAGTLQAAAVGNTPYASYLEGQSRFAFLQPAWRSVESISGQIMDNALSTAVQRAGWI